MNNSVNILEFFYSIDGETKRSGELVWFIRLAGCNLSCIWCDTNWCHNTSGENIDIDVLISRIVSTNNCKKVTITGGEPLIHKNIDKLILKLLENGFDVNIETNGSINPKNILSKEFDIYRSNKSLWYSMDYKCSKSMMNNYMISAKDMSNVLRNSDCLKFVVASIDDLNEAKKRINDCERFYSEANVKDSERCTYYISPCFGEIELPEIIEFMKENNMTNRVKFQLQQHKIIWDPNKRGV